LPSLSLLIKRHAGFSKEGGLRVQQELESVSKIFEKVVEFSIT